MLACESLQEIDSKRTVEIITPGVIIPKTGQNRPFFGGEKGCKMADLDTWISLCQLSIFGVAGGVLLW